MSYEMLSADGLDYMPCRYGNSKLMFRGPAQSLNQPYIAVIGGNEVYGKFSETPMPKALARRTGLNVANFGCLNAGIDAFVKDAGIIELCNRSSLTLVEIMGAQNMSNRHYQVHPRRNDRFVGPSSVLSALYRDVDFTQFHFTRHLLSALAEKSAEKFEVVVDELQSAWVARMQALLQVIQGPVVGFYLSDRPLGGNASLAPLARDPLFVTKDMVDRAFGDRADYVEIVVTPEQVAAGRVRVVCSDLEEPIAQECLGPIAHEAAAKALQPFVMAFESPK